LERQLLTTREKCVALLFIVQ